MEIPYSTLELRYGTLIRWFADRQFGFIRADAGGDLFIHVSGFAEKIAPPQNTRLKFHIVPNPKKPGQTMAVDAEVIVPRIIAAQYSDKSGVL